MVIKLKISSPLEAGRSILDAHNLPPRLCDALEHVSNKLANKNIKLKVVVALRDYQLPTLSIIPSHNTDTGIYASQPPTPGSPLSSVSRFSQITSAFSSLKRLGNKPSALITSFGSNTGSSVTSPTSTIPYTPSTPMSPPPMSACTTATFTTGTDITSPYGACALGIRLVHTTRLDAKSKRTLQHILDKTRAKFDIGYELLPQIIELDPNGTGAGGITDSIIRRSVIQDEVLFSGKALTLIALDRCYTFKSALSSYSRVGSQTRLEDAVDELRRLYLANGSRKVSRTDIVRSYDWLSVSDQALYDVDKMYRRAYGGAEGYGAIEGLAKFKATMFCNTKASCVSLRNQMAYSEQDKQTRIVDWAAAQYEVEKQLDLHGGVSPASLCWTESDNSDDDFDLPSWEDKDEVFRIPETHIMALSLKRNSTPRALNIPLRQSTPRAIPVNQQSITPVQQAPAIPLVSNPVKAIPVRPASTQPPPAPTSEKPPACILSKTPPPRSLTHSLPKLQIPTTGIRSNSAGASPPLLKLQTSFPAKPVVSKPVIEMARDHVRATGVLPAANDDTTETPCTALPAPGPIFNFPPSLYGHTSTIDTGLSPTSVMAANFYGVPFHHISNNNNPYTDTPKTANTSLWHPHASIAQMLSPDDYRMSSMYRPGSRTGPMTPNVADDISPITRGEWGALFAGAGFSNARQVMITTCQASSPVA